MFEAIPLPWRKSASHAFGANLFKRTLIWGNLPGGSEDPSLNKKKSLRTQQKLEEQEETHFTLGLCHIDQNFLHLGNNKIT